MKYRLYVSCADRDTVFSVGGWRAQLRSFTISKKIPMRNRGDADPGRAHKTDIPLADDSATLMAIM